MSKVCNVENSQRRNEDDLESPRGNILMLVKRFLFVAGTLAVVFTAFRNSITWHVQRFWGASGSFWQSGWDWILDISGGDHFILIVCGLYMSSMTVYVGVSFLYFLLDVTKRPAFLYKYKTQPGTNDYLDTERMMKVGRQLLINAFVVSPPCLLLVYYLMNLRGYDSGQELPTFQWVLLELVVFVVFEEIGFYYSHRLFHHRRLYKHIHKKHHEWTAPIAVISAYCHPIEHICANIVPFFIGPLIMGSHVATIWLWLTVGALNVLNDHSGYHFPFMPSPEFHDYHHLKFTQCYGVLGILDRFHNTDDQFRTSPQYHRHLVSTSTKSMCELYPDVQKGKVL